MIFYIYLIFEGFVEGIKKIADSNDEEFVQREGTFFGELAMLNEGDVRGASIAAGGKINNFFVSHFIGEKILFGKEFSLYFFFFFFFQTKDVFYCN